MPSDTKPDPSKSSGSSPPLPEFLTAEEAADLLRVNIKTLYEAIQLNQVPGVVRVGRAIRVRTRDLLGPHGQRTRELINSTRGDGHTALTEKNQ